MIAVAFLNEITGDTEWLEMDLSTMLGRMRALQFWKLAERRTDMRFLVVSA